MKKLISALILMSSLSAAADTYNCYIAHSSQGKGVGAADVVLDTSVEQSTFITKFRGKEAKVIVSVTDGDKVVPGEDYEEEVNPYLDSNIITLHFFKNKEDPFSRNVGNLITVVKKGANTILAASSSNSFLSEDPTDLRISMGDTFHMYCTLIK